MWAGPWLTTPSGFSLPVLLPRYAFTLTRTRTTRSPSLTLIRTPCMGCGPWLFSPP